ncbi:MAG: putative phosphothreonine lyase domain-containing protein [Promethearchaeota archaeon]
MLWFKIKEALNTGKLGHSAKVSTARPNPNTQDPNKKVICVYTYNWTDEEDVIRIREELRKIGVIWEIPYKVDEDTFKCRYRVKGDRRISRYYV